MSTLYYVADPMCSWCWGFAPVLEQVVGELPSGVDIQYVMGGLARDSDEPMSQEVRAYVQNAWREVSVTTGARFNWDFWDRCQPRRSTYPACRAALAGGLQGALEEISFQPAASTGGENYGWRLMEGTRCFNPATNCNDGSLVLPILEYGHVPGNCGASVTGGYRYRGAQHPQLSGVYFFADYCTGNFYGAVEESEAWTLLGPVETPYQVRTFGEDEGGEIYFADASTVYRIEAPPPPPRISDGGVVSAATYRVGSGLAPGSLATAFGMGLADSTAVATEHPLPTELGGGSMTFNGNVPAPQIFASAGQRNFQIPWELVGLARASLTVTVGEQTSPEAVVPLARVSPGIFVLNYSGQAAAFITPGGAVAGPVGGVPGARPAKPGETLEVMATGLGPVTNPPATGGTALADPASMVLEHLSVRIADKPVPVEFAGLAPTHAGLYLVRFPLPTDVARGAAVPIAIRVAGVDSKTAYIAIEQEPEPTAEEQEP